MTFDLDVATALVAYLLVIVAPPVYLAWRLLWRKSIRGDYPRYLGVVAIAFVMVLLSVLGIASLLSYIALSLLMARLISERLGARTSILVGFIVSGLIAGALQVIYWPSDTAVYYDVFGGLVGEEIHEWALNTFGDPHSPFAEESLPLLFRYPWVLVAGSLLVWSTLGLAFAVLVGHRLLRVL